MSIVLAVNRCSPLAYVQMFTLPSKRSVCQSGRWPGRARPNKAKERP